MKKDQQSVFVTETKKHWVCINTLLLAALLAVSMLWGCGGQNADHEAPALSPDEEEPTGQEQQNEQAKVQFMNFTLLIPKSWQDCYVTEMSEEGELPYVAFYETGCHSQTGAGWLFSIECYEDDTYLELPDFELLGEQEGIRYVALYPTDVQFEGASESAAMQYRQMIDVVRQVTASFAFENAM